MTKEELSKTIINAAVPIAEQCLSFSHNGTFSELVKAIGNSVNALACSLLEQSYWLADCEYNLLRDRDKIKIKDTKKTKKVLTAFGEVTLRRRLYQTVSNKKSFFAIDQRCGVEKYSRIESSLKAKLIDVAIDTSYGKASKFLDKVVSRQSVFNFCKDIQINAAPVVCNTNAHNVYIEADEDHIHLNNGKPGIVKIAYTHEGRKKVCNGRTELINPRYFVSVDDNCDTLWSDIKEHVDCSYANPNVSIHGDGGTWIKESARIFKGTPFYLDKFHTYQAIRMLAAGDHRKARAIKQAVQKKDRARLLAMLQSMYSPIEEKKIVKTIIERWWYLINNLDDISFAKDIVCSAEAHVSHLLSSRLSSRPMGWSLSGAERIAKLRAYRLNGGNIENLTKLGKAPKILSQNLSKPPKPNCPAVDKSTSYFDAGTGKVVGFTGISTLNWKTPDKFF